MNAIELRDHLNQIISDGYGQWPVLLTDIDENGTGLVYEPVDVDALVGDDDEWISIDIRRGTA
ncbi:hypothetical protein CDO52_00850 [Nocardiopsis gilva YIM 90087]|uniref:Uncharacterized protein n=1 Tax=Nocardiopsis gilva YIM 90087 TaxID=1235441 RepID=A0A223S0A5_9ACTN|nr:hypothetical protein [Nocardiopsis gilva]ASU81527.1 hypothetical protein CDO52_00850 [Nocardiopsis gilva YIM 90087]